MNYRDIEIIRGTSFSATIDLVNSVTGLDFDTTGYIATGAVYYEFGDVVSLQDFTIYIVANKINVTLAPAQTLTLVRKKYVYSIFISDMNDTYCVARGIISML